MSIIIILFLVLLPIMFMFTVDYRLSRIVKELKTLNTNMQFTSLPVEVRFTTESDPVVWGSKRGDHGE